MFGHKGLQNTTGRLLTASKCTDSTLALSVELVCVQFPLVWVSCGSTHQPFHSPVVTKPHTLNKKDCAEPLSETGNQFWQPCQCVLLDGKVTHINPLSGRNGMHTCTIWSQLLWCFPCHLTSKLTELVQKQATSHPSARSEPIPCT